MKTPRKIEITRKKEQPNIIQKRKDKKTKKYT